MNFKIYLPVLAILGAVSCGSRSGSQQPAGGPGFPGGPAADVTPSVEVVTASKRDVAEESTYSSTVEAYATNNIMPQTGARIRKINVEVGDYVVKGQVLAEMDRLQLDQLELQIQNDEIEYARLKGLYEEGGVSQSDFEAAELGYKVRKTNYQNLLENTILRSPINGYVTARNFDKGDMFSMSAPLFTVQQVIPVKLLVGISENEYTKVKKGDTVSLTVDALPGRSFTGKVNRLYPTINAATHTFNAEVVVQNSDRALRPGMFARVKPPRRPARPVHRQAGRHRSEIRLSVEQRRDRELRSGDPRPPHRRGVRGHRRCPGRRHGRPEGPGDPQGRCQGHSPRVA